MIDERGIDFVDVLSPFGSPLVSQTRGRSNASCLGSNVKPAGLTTFCVAPGGLYNSTVSAACRPIYAPDDELPGRSGAALGKERAYPQILVYPVDFRGVERALRPRGDRAERYALSAESVGHRSLPTLGAPQHAVPLLPKDAAYPVGQPFDRAESEQVGSIPAVRSRRDIPAGASRAARAAVAGGATVGQTSAQCPLFRDVAAGSRVDARSKALLGAELALNQLSAASNRTRRVAPDEMHRRAGCVRITMTGTDLLG